MYDFSEEFRRRVELIFRSECTILYPTTPIQWDDVAFKQPSNGPWVAFTFLTNEEKAASIGRKYVVRTSGFVQIDVMFPENSGSAEPRKMANRLGEIFAQRKFSAESINISFYEKHITKAPTDGPRVRYMCRVFFKYDGERVREGVQHIV